METTIYNQKGEESGKIKIPKNIFGLAWNDDLVHQVVVSMQSNKRAPIAHAKGRGEVSGGGKKPWRQKGTGRARVGSSRSPIWKGGGVTHGPLSEKNYTKKINKKMRQKALFVALSRKLHDNEILFLDKIDLDKTKTKEAVGILKALSKVKGFEKLVTKKKNAALVTMPAKDVNTNLSFRNIAGIGVGEIKNLNVLDILSSKYLIILDTKDSVGVLESRVKA
ncbi:MAG: 50S ribosomal protein L4 [Parcubacteria group bacterium CG10_big_fil_rev_8_21_14_0_10_38_31]|nr:MAG: 50S ribosomal protein L4 [Parcubacteria group bacterium CG10_big_fil_rev_8_21_14_0_10_38_31]